MKNKFFIRILAVLLSIFLVFTASSCESKGSPSGASSGSTQSGNGLNPSASLRVWFTMNTAENNALQKIADQFEKETDVSVEILDSNFFSIRQKFPSAADSSSKPDVVYIQSADLGLLAENGYLREINWLDNSIRSRFYDMGFDAMKFKGVQYGVGYSIDAYGIVYNKALITSIPKTWKDYFSKARELTKRNGNKISVYGTKVAVNNYWFIYPLIRNEGGYYFGQKQDGTYDPSDIGIDNAGTKAAINKLLQLKKEGLTTQAYTEIDSSVSAAFSKGQIAMFIYGLWDASIYQSKGVNYGYAPLPNNDDGTPSRPLSTVQGLVLNKFSEWPAESDAFLKYILKDENQQLLYEAGNDGENRSGARNTCNKSVVASKYVQGSEILKSLIDVSLTGEVFPINPEAGILWNYSTTALNSIFFKNASVDTKLKELSDTIKADIAAMNG